MDGGEGGTHVTTEVTEISGMDPSEVDPDDILAKMGGKAGTYTEVRADGTTVTYEVDMEEEEVREREREGDRDNFIKGRVATNADAHDLRRSTRSSSRRRRPPPPRPWKEEAAWSPPPAAAAQGQRQGSITQPILVPLGPHQPATPLVVIGEGVRVWDFFLVCFI